MLSLASHFLADAIETTVVSPSPSVAVSTTPRLMAARNAVRVLPRDSATAVMLPTSDIFETFFAMVSPCLVLFRHYFGNLPE